jgi:hypothetical protein
VESSHDLSKLALCSRRCYSLVLPILYSSFADDGPLLRTPPFLAAIVRRPQLARYVKRLAYNAHAFDSYPKLVKDPFNEIQYEIKAAISRVCGGDDDEVRAWYHSLYYSTDARTALVLIFLPNLSTLNLPHYPVIDEWVYPEYTSRVLSQASQSPTYNIPSPCRLKQLRNLDVGDGYVGAIPWEFVTPLLQLPSLRCLRCSGVLLGDTDINSIKEIKSHITHFRLELSSSSPAALVQLLKSCLNLTQFSYIHYDGVDTSISNPFIPATIRAGLMHLKDSLQGLTLFNLDEEYGNSTVQDMLLPLGSLAEFRKLQRLHATMRTLLGHEDAQATPGALELGDGQSDSGTLRPLRDQAISFVESLPESLQELAMEYCIITVYSVLSVLFESIRKGKFQNLTAVKLTQRKGVTIGTEEAIRWVKEGKALGILVIVIL